MKLIFRILLNTFAVLLASFLVPGIFVANLYTALIVALILGLINLLIKPIIFVLTLPITIITLGLFSLVINALLFWLTATVVKGFSVSGFVVRSLFLSSAFWVTGLLSSACILYE
jgi:putative membrane protein